MHLTRRQLMTTGMASSSALAMPSILRAADKLTVTISSSQPAYQVLLNELGAEFSARNPSLAVKFSLDGDNWDPLLNNTLRAAVVGALPDATWQSLTYAGILAGRKIAQPLNPFFADDTKNLQAMGLSKPMIEATTVGASVYGVPLGTTIPVVYCNMNLLRKAGYAKPQPPGTWEEIIEIGAKVAELGGNINGGYIEYGGTNAWMFQNLLASYGGRMMNEARTAIAFDGVEGLQSLQMLSRFGSVCTNDMTIDQARQAFNAGVTALHIRSASGTTAVAKAASGHFDLAVAQFPLPNPNGRLAGAGHGFFMFTKDQAKQKVVWEFMKFAVSPPGQMILAKNTGFMPINLQALNDPAFLDQYFQINPYHRAVVERMAITGDQFSFPSNNTVKIVQTMSDEMRDVVTHRTKPEVALERMATQTRKLLG